MVALDKDSERYVEPPDFPLKRAGKALLIHQLACVKRLLDILQSPGTLTLPNYDEVHKFVSDIILFSLAPGMGKTHVICTLAHEMKTNPKKFEGHIMHSSLNGNARCRVVGLKNIKTVIVVAKSTLKQQWSDVCSEMGLKFTSFTSFRKKKTEDDDNGEDPSRKRKFSSLDTESEDEKEKGSEPKAKVEYVYDDEKIADLASGEYDIVFMTLDAYDQFSKMEYKNRPKVIFLLLVVDEADSVQLPNYRRIYASKLILMTGTANCFDSGEKLKSTSRIFEEWKMESKYFNANRVSDRVRDAEVHAAIQEHMTVTCKKEFCEESISLPKVEKRKIPEGDLMRELKRIRLKDFCQSAAFKSLSEISAGSCKDLKAFSKICDKIMASESDEAKSLIADRCALTLKPLASRSPSCYAMPCCNMKVLKGAIYNYSKMVDTVLCPCCDKYYDKDTIPKSHEIDILNTIKWHSSMGFVINTVHENILANDESKILIFDKNGKFDKDTEIIKMLNEKNIKYKVLYGNSKSTDSQIRRLRDGEINVLLISTKTGAAGLNLEFCTDIFFSSEVEETVFKQAIHRGQRIGRKGDGLKVYHMQRDDPIVS